MKKISIIICTRNRSSLLNKLLDCFKQQNREMLSQSEILIVDNDSCDDTKKIVDKFKNESGLEVKYFLEKNIGSSYPRNTGAKFAQGEYFLFLDDDVVLESDFLENVFKAIKEFNQFEIIGFRVLLEWNNIDKPYWFNFNPVLGFNFSLTPSIFPLHDLGNAPIEYPNKITRNPISAAFLIKKDAFNVVGFFREDLGINKTGLSEDFEFFAYAISRKLKAIYCPYVTVMHPVYDTRLSINYIHGWYFKLGKSLYRAINTGRLYEFNSKPVMGLEGLIANKFPKELSSFLNIRIFRIPVFLYLKFIFSVVLLPFTLLLIFVKKPFYPSTLLFKTFGQMYQSRVDCPGS